MRIILQLIDLYGNILEFFNGIDTDKPHPYIEKCMAIKEPITKVCLILQELVVLWNENCLPTKN